MKYTHLYKTADRKSTGESIYLITSIIIIVVIVVVYARLFIYIISVPREYMPIIVCPPWRCRTADIEYYVYVFRMRFTAHSLTFII